MSDTGRQVVVVAPNWLGDGVMALPAISDLRRHVGDASLSVAARDGLVPFFGTVRGVDRVLSLESNGRPATARAAADSETLAQGRFDVAVLLPNSYYSAWIATRAGIPERWGYRADRRGGLLTRAIDRPRRRLHQAAYYRALTTALGVDAGPLTPALDVSDDARRAASTLLEEKGIQRDARFVALAPGAVNGSAKQWPPGRFAELIPLLQNRTSRQVVVLGTPGEVSVGVEIEQALSGWPHQPEKCLNLIGRTDVAALMGVLERCDLLVSNDSGAMHLASALGRPVVAIFGATDERLTAPVQWDTTSARHEIVSSNVWCRPCLLHECPIDHRCMTHIGASEVVARIERCLAAAGQKEVH